MLIRMYEYDTQIAINNSSTIEDDMLTVRFPNSGILYLRSSDNVPKTKKIRIITGNQQKPKKNDDYMKQITSDFSKIYNYLNNMLDNKQISDRLYHDLREFINRVADQIARKHDDIKKGVTNIMGGKIIVTATKRYYNEGFNLGSEQMADLINELNSRLIEANRYDDLKLSSANKSYQKQLMKEFGLEIPKDIPDNLIPDNIAVN
ncbi:unnamed protein product [Cylicocyclus nassatus]|uniref:Uncharacterized protein n=1 Tax=Cylicocyclus nassatus TaxID=53992 RepID=A0AA36M440_CYLNA|nr:unnamed protein product [Cylicocyclus nassatus]